MFCCFFLFICFLSTLKPQQLRAIQNRHYPQAQSQRKYYHRETSMDKVPSSTQISVCYPRTTGKNVKFKSQFFKGHVLEPNEETGETLWFQTALDQNWIHITHRYLCFVTYGVSNSLNLLTTVLKRQLCQFHSEEKKKHNTPQIMLASMCLYHHSSYHLYH